MNRLDRMKEKGLIKELEFAPKWDGHKPEDIIRLFALLD